MQHKLVGFGELLLRLDAPGNLRFSQVEQFQAKYTGGEANVLVAARNFGISHCEMVSCVPNNPLGHACIEFLNRYGIDTSSVHSAGDRLGILFVETGTSVRPSQVVYDRLHTSFRSMDPDSCNWESTLKGAGVVHITGTAPALGSRVNKAIDQCLLAAKKLGCLVSFDCSYRSALWSIEEASVAYRKIAAKADLLFASPGDAKLFFGVDHENVDQRMATLMEDFGVSHLAYTDRIEESASANRLTGVYWHQGNKHSSREYAFEIVDRIGSGDAFAGGIVSRIIKETPGEQTVEFATAAAVLKHTVLGDFCLVSEDEVNELVAGKSLRIRR